MLTSSPVATTCPSPRSFHHATAASTRSPHQSPRIASPLSRRASRSSLAHSPTLTRSKQYVAVDAATQYSPMEPFDPRVALRSEDGPRPRHPAVPAPAAVAADPAHRASPSTSAAPPPEPQLSGRPDEDPSANATLSPSKRRKSPETVDVPSLAVSAGTNIGTSSSSLPNSASQPSLPKRARPNQRPCKMLPLKYELCDVEDIVVLISNMLSELIETNDAISKKGGQLTRFHSRTAPGISVLDYLHRLAKHATLTPPLLLSMVFYIDRLCVSYSDFTINTLTVHRFLITAATVAGKGLSDAFWNNSFYARVGGVKIAELKLLELEFLYRVDWKIVPDPEVLVAYYKALVERCQGYTLQESEERSLVGEGANADASGEADHDDEVSDDISEDDDSDASGKTNNEQEQAGGNP